MLSYEFSQHAYDVLKERGIQEAWVRLALEKPERKETKDDGTIHYIKSIEERGNRHLRIVTRQGCPSE